ncbi:MAG TPA: helix-turn-helix transcriptional regulator [Acidimicrobiales bacterium]|nr:helix-turn-helix transcriptional regulator [Acidimicrobiales bacterium]
MAEDDVLRRFGERVRQLRLAAEWSQEDLAEQSGLHRTYISGVEGGHRNASALAIVKLATALRVDVGELFTLVNTRRRQR